MLKIVVTGPESSGKSTLAAALAAALGLPWVPEFARCYLPALGRPYRKDDLQDLYAGQLAWEHWYAQNGPPQAPVLICDTDWTVLHIWAQHRYGPANGFLPPKPPQDRFYLLCQPDIPWEPDPLREHPTERWALYQRYQALLDAQSLPYRPLSGPHAERLARALAEIRKVL